MAVAADALTDPADPADRDGRAAADAALDDPGRPREWWAVTARRVSGLVLLVVVPVQLALTRVFEDPADATVPVVQERWAQPGWRLLECALLAAVAVHVVASVRVSSARSRWGSGARTVVVAVTTVVAVAVAGFGSAIVITAPW